MDAKQLLGEALRLSDEARAALAGELIQSLGREIDPDTEAAWSEEIRARLERLGRRDRQNDCVGGCAASHPHRGQRLLIEGLR